MFGTLEYTSEYMLNVRGGAWILTGNFSVQWHQMLKSNGQVTKSYQVLKNEIII